MSFLNRMKKQLRWVLPVAAAAVIAGACDLNVSDPQAIRESEATGPAAVPLTINGVISDVANMSEHYALYSGMFTDEFILAGTFPTRSEVDERRVNPSNATVAGEVEESLQTARRQAFKMDSSFNEFLGDDAFPQDTLRHGITMGKYVQGLATLQLAELYCQPVLEPGGSQLSTTDAVNQALTLFQDAQSAADQAIQTATAAGNSGLVSRLEIWQTAAELGEARALLFLGQHDQAATVASNVPTEHRLFSEFSSNSPSQFNKIFDLTFGSQNEVIRWTIGDGQIGARDNEKFAEFDEFVSLGLIDPDFCADCAFNSQIPVQQQLLYTSPDDDIAISKGEHARLIEAEAAIRNGNTGMAETIINDLRSSFDDRFGAENDFTPGEPDPVTLTGDLQEDLATLLGEYARETWQTGTRQENLRRMVEEFGTGSSLDLYPERDGDQTCWPISEQEQTGGTP